MYLSKKLEDVKSSCEIQPAQSIILNGQRNFGSVSAIESVASGEVAQGDFDNSCSASPRDFIDEVFGVKTKPKKQSIELSYSQYLNRSGNYCAMDNGESVAAYVWESSHWGRFSDSAGKRMALNWLQANEPQKATHTAACSLHNTSVLAMPLIPSEPNQTVVPMKNVWLTVSDDGKFTIKIADKTWGVKYVIDAALPLDGKQEQMQYEPKTLPEDSLFHQFLSVSLPDEEVRALVQEYCGYTLLNDVRHQVAQIWVGDGRNGKSVLLKIIQKLHAKVGSLQLDKLDGFGLTSLVDSSLIVCSEAPKRGINEQVFKQIISGDPISVEYKFKDSFTYSPRGKFLIACNRFPHITDDSNGVWRRLQIIKWDVNLTDEQEIPNIDDMIISKELSLVVDWCLEGLSRLLVRGDFAEPESVLHRKKAEKVNSNNVLAFVDDHGLDTSLGQTTFKHRIYEQYEEYCHSHGLAPFQGNEFWKRMAQKFPDMKEKKKPDSKGARLRAVNLTFGNHPVN